MLQNVENWLILQTVHLDGIQSIGPSGVTLQQPYVVGDNQAHTWRISVYKYGAIADISSYTATAYLKRKDERVVVLDGKVRGNVIEFVFTQECYAIPGRVIAVARLSTGDGAVITLPHIEVKVESQPSGDYIDPGEVIPSLDELLALIDETRDARDGATTATEQAYSSADTANTAAKRAEDAADALDEQLPIIAENVSDALQAATESKEARDGAKQSQDAAAESETNAAASAERAGEFASLAQSNFQLATFALDGDGHILQYSDTPDQFVFHINDDNGHMEAIYNA